MEIHFFSTHLDDQYKMLRQYVIDAVRRLPEEEVAGCDPDELSKKVVSPFEIKDIPTLKFDDREMDAPEYSMGSNQARIKVYVPYTGDSSVFCYCHSSRPLPCPSYEVHRDHVVIPYAIQKDQISTLDSLVKRDTDLVEQYLVPLRFFIPKYNETLLNPAKAEIQKRLDEIASTRRANADLAKLPIRIRKRADETEKLVIPVQRKQLPVPVNKPTAAALEFSIEMAEYDDILKTITSMAKVMERSPSAFADMNEEPLRTVLLVALNGIYEGQATGETFNGQGKTDILIRRDDKNVFIAECLMWKGPKYLLGKMNDQLFNYAVWRDSKLSLIVFNRGGTFSNVISTMKETVKTHPQCLKELPYTHESGARYEFKRHDDPDRHFVLTALAFDVPE